MNYLSAMIRSQILKKAGCTKADSKRIDRDFKNSNSRSPVPASRQLFRQTGNIEVRLELIPQMALVIWIWFPRLAGSGRAD